MQARASAVAVLVMLLAACQTDATNPDAEPDDAAGRNEAAPAAAPAPSPSSPTTCLTCTFEPRVYTRRTSTPVTEVVTFPGNPAGAYTIEIDDLGTRGANATVELNGTRLDVLNGKLRQDVVLDWQNALHVRLTGKPGSQLSARMFQEIASISVTPDDARSRIAATLQFSAVAKDRNGVAIPRQTFTWESGDLTIATIDAATGLATTTGQTYDMTRWSYKTITTGAGPVEILAHADDAPGMDGIATW